MGSNEINKQLNIDVNTLNNFFANLGPPTVTNLKEPESDKYFKNINFTQNSFVLQETNEAEVLRVELSLKNKKSCGFDEITPVFMTEILHLIIKLLTHIFNLSFQLDIVPLKLKIVKIIPMYKSDE